MNEILEMDREAKGKFMREVMLWDSKKLATESYNFMQQYKNTEEGRFFLQSYFLGQILLVKHSRSSFFSDYGKSKSFDELMQTTAPSMLMNYLFNGKLFTMTEPVYDLLEQTKNKVFLRKHPFYVFAIDQKVKTKYEGLNIIFMMLRHQVNAELNTKELVWRM
jgi:hypothetical protein